MKEATDLHKQSELSANYGPNANTSIHNMNMIPDPALQHEQIDEVTETGLNVAEMKVGGIPPPSTPEIYFAKKSMIKSSKRKLFYLNSLYGNFPD